MSIRECIHEITRNIHLLESSEVHHNHDIENINSNPSVSDDLKNIYHYQKATEKASVTSFSCRIMPLSSWLT